VEVEVEEKEEEEEEGTFDFCSFVVFSILRRSI
jgi:hypothetical protein